MNNFVIIVSMCFPCSQSLRSAGPHGMVRYVREMAEGWPEMMHEDTLPYLDCKHYSLKLKLQTFFHICHMHIISKCFQDDVGSDPKAQAMVQLAMSKAAKTCSAAASAALQKPADRVAGDGDAAAAAPKVSQSAHTTRVALIRKQLQTFREPVEPVARKSRTRNGRTKSIKTDDIDDDDDEEFGILLGLRPPCVDYDESSRIEAYLAVRELSSLAHWLQTKCSEYGMLSISIGFFF